MVRHGCDLQRLKQVLGHSSINTAAVYLQFNDKDSNEIYRQIPF